MPNIRARIRVAADHTISGIAPADVPPGEHDAIIPLPASGPVRAKKPFNVDDLPIVDLGPWPEGVSLRREDIYDDDGR